MTVECLVRAPCHLKGYVDGLNDVFNVTNCDVDQGTKKLRNEEKKDKDKFIFSIWRDIPFNCKAMDKIADWIVLKELRV